MKFLDIELNTWAKAGLQEEYISVIPARGKLEGPISKAFRSRKLKPEQRVVQLSLFAKQ